MSLPSGDRRRQGGAAAVLLVVLAVLVVREQARPTAAKTIPGAARRSPSPGGAVDLARPQTAAVALGAFPIGVLAPDELANVATIDEVLDSPEAFRGRLLRCDNTIEALPDLWQTPSLAGDERRSPPLADPARLFGGDLAPHRLTLFCRSAALTTVPLLVYFDAATRDGILAVGGQSRVLLRMAGLGPAGQILARYVAISALARSGPQVTEDHPDWLGALVAPAPWVGHARTCVAAAPPELDLASEVSREPLASLVALASAASATAQAPPAARGAAGLLARLACRDARGLDVPVTVWLAPAQSPEALRIVQGTRVVLQILGTADNRVFGAFVRLGEGSIAEQQADLRRAWVDGPSAVGRLVTCTSQGLPAPQVVAGADPDDLAIGATGIAKRKAWVVCAQPPLPAVHMTLYLSAGKELELLAVGRGTRLQARLVKTRAGRALATLDKVVDGALDPAGEATDLRRFHLMAEALKWQNLTCVLAGDMGPAPAGTLPESARSLSRHASPGRVWLAHCKDSRRPFDGQRFGVFCPGLRIADPPRGGTALALRFDGVANELPVADCIGSESAAGGPSTVRAAPP